MIRVSLRDARAHFPRFIMSLIAIALGVSFVVGSFCFRAMLNNQIDQMLGSNSDHDVYVRGSQERRDDDSQSLASSTTTYNDIDDSLVDVIDDVKGVASTSLATSTSGVLTLVGKDGNAVTTMGSPTVSVGLAHGTWRSARMTEGHYPKNRKEIALHSFAAERSGLRVGDTATLVYPSGPEHVTVVGVFTTDTSQAGAIIVALTPKVEQELYRQVSGTSGQVEHIGVYGSANHGQPLDDEEQRELADRINKALPADAKAHAITGDELRDESSKTTKEMLGFIQPLILIFAAIALFVGSFIIANTFSMIVRESMRGYALLRSIGASSAQVFSTVIIEALLLGLIGSGAGIGLGWGMVKLIANGMAELGVPLSGSVSPSVTDMLVGLVVGVAVTLIGATLPARRAALAPPIEAMNETVNPEASVVPRAIIGVVLLAFGAFSWLLCWRIAVSDGTPSPWHALNALAERLGTGWTLGLGAAFVVIGVIVMAPALVAPASVVLGWLPSLLLPVSGRLAARNLARQKRSTANTAAALFVGVAIVSCLGVVAASVKTSVSGIIDSGLKSDLIVMSNSGQIPDKAIEDIRRVKGVKSVSYNRMLMGVTFDGTSVLSTFAEQPSLFSDVFEPVTTAGDADRALRGGQLVVGKDIAEERGWSVGDTVKVEGKQVSVDQEATARAQADYQAQMQSQGQNSQDEAQQVAPSTLVKTKVTTTSATMTVGAIVSNSAYRSGVFMNDERAETLVSKQSIYTVAVYVKARPNADVNAMRTRMIRTLKPFYVLSVMDREDYKSAMGSMVDQVLMILYALLALSIVIAIFGIINTLALSVSERTREIGLLRAIGTSNAKIRGMLAIEASLISVLGTLLGLAVGVAAGTIIQKAYEADGMEYLTLPWNQLGLFLLLSILVGVVASLPPAHRALKAPVLNAIASE